MGLGVGILLIAVGAILAFAVSVDTSGTGVNLHTIGLILLAVGVLGKARRPRRHPSTVTTFEV